MKLEVVSPDHSLESGMGLRDNNLDGRPVPVVVWVGFTEAPVSRSDAYRSVVKATQEVADFADPNVVVIVKRQDAGPCDALMERFEDGAGNRLFRPEILTFGEGALEGAAQVESVVNRIMAGRYAALAQRNTDLTRQLFEVRRVHEDLQAAFEQVEQYLHANGLSEPKLLLELPPADAEGGPALLELEEGAPVVIGLPYELNKIAGFSINVRRGSTARRSAARLLVTLTSGTASQVYGTWSTPLDRLPESGWFSFVLDRLSIDYGHSLRVAIQLEGRADVALVLSAKPLLGASLLPRSTGINRAVHALPAFRLWRGLPGTRMTHGAELQPLDFEHHDGHRSDRRIPVNVGLDGAEQVHADEVVSAPLVSVSTDDQSIQVHPVAKGAVVARVRQAVPQERCRLEATVGVHHEEASGVEFAMTVARNADEALETFARGSREGEPAWTLASFSENADLVVECDPSDEERFLYLATRLPQGGTTKYAWARFRNLTVVL